MEQQLFRNSLITLFRMGSHAEEAAYQSCLVNIELTAFALSWCAMVMCCCIL